MSNRAKPGVLERNTTVPLYRQLAEGLRRSIVAGRYAAGAPLPTERELMAQHDLSRVTVRLAMDLLLEQDLIVRRRGKGTFVAPKRLRHDLSVLSGFYEALSAHGKEPTIALRDFRVLDRGPRRKFALPYDRVAVIGRIYSVADEPIAVSRCELHPRAAALTRALAEQPNYAILTSMLGFTIERAEVSMRAQLPDKETAGLLRISTRDPVLILDRTTFGTGDVPIECSVFSIRSDRYEFALSVREGRAVDQAIRARDSKPVPLRSA